MKNIYPRKQLALILTCLIMAVIMFLPGCKTDELEEQLSILSENQAFLAEERDSLQRELMVRTHQLDTTYAGYQGLSSDLETLTSKNRSLQSRYNSRGKELEKATQSNADMGEEVTQQEIKSDSLQKEIVSLRENLASMDRQVTESQKTYSELVQAVEDQEEKIIADSIAEASKPEEPVEQVIKEKGYINISELGGGFGLGDVSVDYSKSLISVNNVFAYMINKNFLTGIGTGVHVYNGGIMVPLYIDMRYTFKESKLTPFIVADGGVLVNVEDIKSSGIFINPAFGLNKKLSDNMSLHLSSGIFVQHAPVRSAFINFKAGLSFKGK